MKVHRGSLADSWTPFELLHTRWMPAQRSTVMVLERAFGVLKVTVATRANSEQRGSGVRGSATNLR